MQPLVTIFALIVLLITDSGGKLTTLSPCICLGYEAVFQCIVTGGIATIWRGTAFDQCPNDRITLRHGEFNQPGYSQNCGGSGLIIGRAVSVMNGSYTSQLVVNVSQGIIGANVECASDSGSHVGTKQIQLTTAPLPPPTSVTLSQINSSHLVFTWNPVSPDCQAVHYKINGTNCGQCPNIVDSNSVMCNIPIVSEQNCILTIAAVVCGNVSGRPSVPIVFELKVPDAPGINVTSEYSGESNKLTEISVELITSGIIIIGPHNVTDISYTINYTDINSGNICRSVTLPASSCNDGICTDVFEVSSSLCPPQTDISVSAFTTNVFGNGQPSDRILIGAINHFVDIDFATNAIKCTFLTQRLGTQKSCAIQYGPKVETQCSRQLSLISSSKGNPTTSDTMNIRLHPTTRSGTEYCYQLTASDGITTVTVVGTFAACSPDQLSDTYGESVRDDIVCGASYTALGTENGFVCYSGTKVGSTAMHYCYDCGFNSVRESTSPVIRTCGRNGQWNGSIPQCDCSHYSVSDLALFIGAIGGIAVLILTIMVTIFAIVVIILCKTKARLSKQLLNQHNKDLEESDKIYEEIAPISQPKMDTENNIAYASCHSMMRSASCAYQLQFTNTTN